MSSHAHAFVTLSHAERTALRALAWRLGITNPRMSGAGNLSGLLQRLSVAYERDPARTAQAVRAALEE